MIITPIRTAKVKPGASSLAVVIDNAVPAIPDRSILLITSKIVSLCENRVIPVNAMAKDALVRQEADWYLPDAGAYGFNFTITNNTLIPSSGIDESNGAGQYVLWPENVQRSANDIRQHLVDRHRLRNLGIVITDSTCTPLRRGTSGIALAHSGFKALHDYVGTVDLFDRPFAVSAANIANGLAAGAVAAMGEGREQTPLCLIEDADFIEFQDRVPSADELSQLRISPNEDIFAPFLSAVDWQRGWGGHKVAGDNNDN